MSGEVAVIIPAYQAAHQIRDALASLDGQAHVTEICVACHDAKTRAAALTFRPVDQRITFTVIDNPSGTTPDALNAALGATSAPIVARLDAHATFTPGYLAAAVDVLNDETIGNVGGVQQAHGTGRFERAVAAAMASLAGSGGVAYRRATTAKDADTVYLGVFRRTALEQVGGFNPACLRNQDAELNIRLRKAGFRVRFDPRLVATYRPRSTAGQLARQYHDYGRWRRFTHRITNQPFGLRQLLVPGAVAVITASTIAAAVTQQVVFWLPALTYSAAVLGAAIHAAHTHPDTRTTDAAHVAVALAVMHWAWGSGFMRGAPTKVRR